MNSTISPPMNSCSQCQKPAILRCAACKDVPNRDNRTESIYYCTSECQKADWKRHKKSCLRLRARKSLYLAADLLQEIFYVYRERLFDKSIAKIEMKDGNMHIYEGWYTDNLSKYVTVYDSLQPFPEQLCQRPEDKKAVLVHLACDDAVGWMQEVVQYVLGGIVSEFEEFSVKLKKNKRELISINITGAVENEDMDHSILKVTLNHGGERYILDFAGAQFGYYEPVTPFDEYWSSRVRTVVLSDNCYVGGTRDKLLEVCKEKGPTGRACRLNEMAYPFLKGAMVTWEKDKMVTVQEMLGFPFDQFKLEMKALVSWIDMGLKLSIEDLKECHQKIMADLDGVRDRRQKRR